MLSVFKNRHASVNRGKSNFQADIKRIEEIINFVALFVSNNLI